MVNQQYQQQERKPIYCRNNCGIEICFDSRKSKSGKSIPIDKSSGLPHQCPKSQYTQQQKSGRNSSANQAHTLIQEVEQQATNTLLHEILMKVETLGEYVKNLADLQNERA